jgi:hypothetical protein
MGIGKSAGLVTTILLIAATWAQAADRYVSTNGLHSNGFTNWTYAATNIQDAINTAAAGETVWVTNGTYVCQAPVDAVANGSTSKTMVAINTSIKLRSVNGPAVTILDANAFVGGSTAVVRRVVHMNPNATGAMLDGFTLTNGCIAGTYLNTPFPHYHGGGLLTYGSSPVATNCVIAGNYCLNGSGVGVFGTATIANSVIGGGNTGSAAIYMTGGTVKDCLVTGNVQGGLRTDNPGPQALNCRFIGNGTYLVTSGGGAYISGGGVLRNCLLAGNSGSDGGGLTVYGSCAVQNCTIASNRANRGSGVLFNAPTVPAGTNLVFESCIISSNKDASVGYNQFLWWATGKVSYTCCPVDLSAYGPGNTTNNPQFVNTASLNLHLRGSSPCIDTGTNNASWITSTTVDLDGLPRRSDGKVDMGCYEFIPKGSVVIVR